MSKETLEFPLNSESLCRTDNVELIIEREFPKHEDVKTDLRKQKRQIKWPEKAN